MIVHRSDSSYTIKALLLLLIVNLSTGLTNLIPSFGVSNHPITFQVLILVQALLVISVYYNHFRNYLAQQLSLLLICLSLSAGAIGVIYYLLFDYFTLVPLFVYCVATIICSLMAFYRFLADLNVPNLTRNFFFWVNTAFLFYYLAIFIAVPFSGYFDTDSQLITNLVTFSLLSGTVFNILITLGAWKVERTSHYS